MSFLGSFNYWIFIFLMMVGFYTIVARGNLVKKVVGLTIFQTSVFIFYISLAKIIGGTAPILVESHGTTEGTEAHGGASGAAVAEAGQERTSELAEALSQAGDPLSDSLAAAAEWGASTTVDGVVYSNPLPHVLILTAIVVGIATTALALALVVRINETYGTIEEDDIHLMDLELEAQ